MSGYVLVVVITNHTIIQKCLLLLHNLMILEFLPYDASGPIWQVVHSAAANAKHNYGLDKKKLIIDEIFADEGPKLKRIRPRAQGRAYKILKPTCHITVVMKASS